MTLKATLQAAAVTAYAAVGDIAKPAVYTHIERGALNIATDSRTDVTTTASLNVVVADAGSLYTKNEMLMRAEYSGMLVISCPVLSMGAIVPLQGDYITITATGTAYKVEGFKKDPADAVYEFVVSLRT